MNSAPVLGGSILSPTALIRRALHRIRPQQAPRAYPVPEPPSRQSQQLTAARIRTAVFPRARHGYEPDAVHQLLGQLADELTRLHRSLAIVYAENDHIKRALKQWQSDHAATCRRPDPGPAGRVDWPVNPAPAGRGMNRC